MDKDLLALVQPMLEQHEGRKRFPYKCTAGKLTIGVGRNIEDRGLADDEINYLLQNDIRMTQADCIILLGEDVWDALSLRRKAALIDWCFNLGRARASTFTNTLLAIKHSRWQDAAHGLRSSKWATQVGKRAQEIASIIEKG